MEIVLWPFNRTWAAADYRRVAAEQARKHQSTYGGVWEVVTQTNPLEMRQLSMNLRGTTPLDLNELRKRYQTAPRQ